MGRVAGFAEMAYYMVRLDIYAHADKEDHCAEDEERRPQPRHRISVNWRHIEEPAPNHIGIYQIEYYTEQYYRQRHPVFTLYQKREDERALEIVEQEEKRHHDKGRLAGTVTEKPEKKHSYEHRGFHHHPTETIVDRGSPLLSIHHSVAGVNTMESYKHNDCEHYHNAHNPFIYFDIKHFAL